MTDAVAKQKLKADFEAVKQLFEAALPGQDLDKLNEAKVALSKLAGSVRSLPVKVMPGGLAPPPPPPPPMEAKALDIAKINTGLTSLNEMLNLLDQGEEEHKSIKDKFAQTVASIAAGVPAATNKDSAKARVDTIKKDNIQKLINVHRTFIQNAERAIRAGAYPAFSDELEKFKVDFEAERALFLKSLSEKKQGSESFLNLYFSDSKFRSEADGLLGGQSLMSLLLEPDDITEFNRLASESAELKKFEKSIAKPSDYNQRVTDLNMASKQLQNNLNKKFEKMKLKEAPKIYIGLGEMAPYIRACSAADKAFSVGLKQYPGLNAILEKQKQTFDITLAKAGKDSTEVELMFNSVPKDKQAIVKRCLDQQRSLLIQKNELDRKIQSSLAESNTMLSALTSNNTIDCEALCQHKESFDSVKQALINSLSKNQIILKATAKATGTKQEADPLPPLALALENGLLAPKKEKKELDQAKHKLKINNSFFDLNNEDAERSSEINFYLSNVLKSTSPSGAEYPDATEQFSNLMSLASDTLPPGGGSPIRVPNIVLLAMASGYLAPMENQFFNMNKRDIRINQTFELDHANLANFKKLSDEFCSQIKLEPKPTQGELVQALTEVLNNKNYATQIIVQHNAILEKTKQARIEVLSPSEYQEKLRKEEEKRRLEEERARAKAEAEAAAKAAGISGGGGAHKSKSGGQSLESGGATLASLQERLQQLQGELKSAKALYDGWENTREQNAIEFGRRDGFRMLSAAKTNVDYLSAKIQRVEAKIAKIELANVAAGSTPEVQAAVEKVTKTFTVALDTEKARASSAQAKVDRISEIPEKLFAEWSATKPRPKPEEVLKKVASLTENESEYQTVLNGLCGKIGSAPNGDLAVGAIKRESLKSTFESLRKTAGGLRQ
jgi:hypothetical protein